MTTQIVWTKINAKNQKCVVDGVKYWVEKIEPRYKVVKGMPVKTQWIVYHTDRSHEVASGENLRTAKAQFAAYVATLPTSSEPATVEPARSDTISAYDWSKLPEPRPRVWYNEKLVSYAYKGFGTSAWYVVYQGERGSHYKQYSTPIFALEPITPVVAETAPAFAPHRHTPIKPSTRTEIEFMLEHTARGHMNTWLSSLVRDVTGNRVDSWQHMSEREAISFYIRLSSMVLVTTAQIAELTRVNRALYGEGKRGDMEASENMRRLCRSASKDRTLYFECLTRIEYRHVMRLLREMAVAV